ncbi:alpha/beta fold hydrolase [Ramlibacter rhizophilus]|nr:alpha/beta hydrolase [Ramlibacter rhizophilus]
MADLFGEAPARSSRWRGGLLVAGALAGATAAWVHERARRAEREHPPTGRFMHLDGVRLHYQTWGSGPDLALLHGNAFYSADLLASGLVQRLARDYRVILFDRPGFGHSSRPRDRLWTPRAQAALLHRALGALGADRPLVLGHSLGALVALAMALDYPASVAGLVLASGYYYPTLYGPSLMVAPVALPVLGDAMRYTVSAVSARLLLGHTVRQAFAPREVPPDFFQQLARELLLRPSQLRAAAEDGALMLPQVRLLAPRYPQLRVPVAVLAGAHDRVVDPDTHSRRLAAELPHSRLHIVRGAGHMVHHAAQEAVEEQVRAVLEDARRPRPPGDTQAAARAQLDALAPDGLATVTASGNPPA